MLFFPKQMMEGYQAKTFGGASETFFMWMLGLMGVQMLGSAFLCATLRYDAASPKARALACLGQVICWGIFFVVDGKCLLTGTVPKAMPPEAFMVNLVIFAVVIVANFLAWRGAGSPRPTLDKLLPAGPLSNPIKAFMANQLFFAFGLIFALKPFMEMYVPGVPARITKESPAAMELTYLIAERIGYGALNMVILAAFAAAGDYNGADTNYRVARAMTYANMVGLGLISRDLVVVNATGWPLPMFTATVAQSLAVTYFAANEIGKTAVAIKKTTKSK